MLLLFTLSLTNAALPLVFQTQVEVRRILTSPYFKECGGLDLSGGSAAELTQSRSLSPLGYTEYNVTLMPRCGEGEMCPAYVKEISITILPYEQEMRGPLVFGLGYLLDGVVEAAPPAQRGGRTDLPPLPFGIPELLPGSDLLPTAPVTKLGLAGLKRGEPAKQLFRGPFDPTPVPAFPSSAKQGVRGSYSPLTTMPVESYPPFTTMPIESYPPFTTMPVDSYPSMTTMPRDSYPRMTMMPSDPSDMPIEWWLMMYLIICA